MEKELRTYNIRDRSGLLVFSTHDVQEAADFLNDNPGHHSDDLGVNEIKAQAREQRDAQKQADREAQEREKEREKLIADRVEELTADPEIFATAVAELERRLGVL
jgi:4-alpha-glucanotransferase